MKHLNNRTGRKSVFGYMYVLASIVALALLVPAAASAEGEFGYLDKWGELGIHDGELNRPHGIAIDSSGNVYVADQGNFRIQKFDSNGAHLDTWGNIRDDELKSTAGLAVDRQGSVYISEWYWTSDDGWVTYTLHSRVRKLNPDGSLVTQWGDTGTGNGQFNGPHGVAVDSNDNVYVADSFNHRIQKFTSNGTFLNKWGGLCDVAKRGPDACDGKFNHPVGIAVDAAGDVYVGDTMNHRIQKFDSNGGLLAKWGSSCVTDTGDPDGCDGEFYVPTDVSVDQGGAVFVADTGNSRIQKFNPDLGQYEYDSKWGVRCVVERENPDTCEGDFNLPYGIELGPDGNVYVADTFNHRIQRFGELPDPGQDPGPGPISPLPFPGGPLSPPQARPPAAAAPTSGTSRLEVHGKTANKAVVPGAKGKGGAEIR